MQVAGVNIVSLEIFSWARIQPQPDVWDFARLDEAIDPRGSRRPLWCWIGQGRPTWSSRPAAWPSSVLRGSC